MQTRVTVEPVYEPVSLAEARLWCRVDDDDTTQDSLITLLIKACRRRAENLTQRAFIQRTLQLVTSRWPMVKVDGVEYTGFALPYPPLRSVTSVQYRDLDGALQTLATDQYVVHEERTPGVIVPEWNVTWPTIRVVPDSIQVTWVAGYAEVGSPSGEASHQAGIPEDLRQWMLARVSTLFDNREHLVPQTLSEAPADFMDGMLDNLVVARRIA